ncbi:MAG: PIN domain-containing protein [Deltaproteobacteria bacterium]|nr:PIN domain-containing protein [Deltaproteobacteria bacterium]
MKHVFVDTGGFLGLLVSDDVSHDQARELFARANTERWQLVTTNAVVFETYGVLLIRSRDKRRAGLTFLDLVETGACRIERVHRIDETEAVSILRRHEDKTYSYCDALSFAVMERLGLREAIAFDRHFREHGRFTVL